LFGEALLHFYGALKDKDLRSLSFASFDQSLTSVTLDGKHQGLFLSAA
jgi:hypothetical protein